MANRPDATLGELPTARIAATFGRRCLLETAEHGLQPATLGNRKLRPVCGDLVDYSIHGSALVIETIKPRGHSLWRQDKQQRRRVVAANVDIMIVVASPKPETAPQQIDRYLAIAALCELDAIIVANKCDLPAHESWVSQYREFSELGYRILPVSTKNGAGVESLDDAIQGRGSVTAGLSGAGKSSLINALIPDIDARTSALSLGSGEGRHTTTASRLYQLNPLTPEDGWIIDAPGVRDIRLWPMSAPELAHGFVEFSAAVRRCKFNDCRHLEEPGCGVIQAVEDGEISQRRYASFRALAALLN